MSDDKFYEGLVDEQHALNQRCLAEVGRLRKENAELRRTIAEFPSDMTAMQDRITMLEGLLRRKEGT